MSRPGFKRVALLLSGLAVGTTFVCITLSQIRLEDVKREFLEHSRLDLALPCLAIYGLVFVLKAVRWRLLLSPFASVSVRALLSPILVGYAGNLLLPAQLGEVLRTYMLGFQLDAQKAPIVATIAVERTFDFLSVLALMSLVLVSAGEPEVAALRVAGFFLGGVSVAALVVLIASLRRPDHVVAGCRSLAPILPARFVDFLVVQLEHWVSGLQSLRDPWLVLRIVLTSIAIWVAMASVIHLSLIATNVEVPVAAAVVVMVLTVIGFALPAIPGFVGTIQLSFLVALGPFGVGPDSAVSASIYYHVLITIPPLILAGIIVLHVGGRSVVDLTSRR